MDWCHTLRGLAPSATVYHGHCKRDVTHTRALGRELQLSHRLGARDPGPETRERYASQQNHRQHCDAQDRQHPFARPVLHADRGTFRADHAHRTPRPAFARRGDLVAERGQAVVQVCRRLGHLRAAARPGDLQAHGRSQPNRHDRRHAGRSARRETADRGIGAAVSRLRRSSARRRAWRLHWNVLRLRSEAARVRACRSANADGPRCTGAARAVLGSS